MTVFRVLGIDPGSRVTGVGVVQADGENLRYIYSESISVGSSDLGSRLAGIYYGIGQVIDRYKPQDVALEQVFLARNPRAALILGHARGSALLAAIHHQRVVSEYSASAIKNAVVGTGRADKIQVQHMVKMLLGLKSAPLADESDALACAICHIHTSQSQRALLRTEAT